MHQRTGQEKEGAPGEEFPMPISPLKATNQCTACTLLKKGPTSLDPPKLQTSESSVATEEDASWPDPWEQTNPGRPCGPEVAATSLQELLGGEKTCLPDPEIKQSRVHREDPLPDGVYEHPEILNHDERLEV